MNGIKAPAATDVVDVTPALGAVGTVSALPDTTPVDLPSIDVVQPDTSGSNADG